MSPAIGGTASGPVATARFLVVVVRDDGPLDRWYAAHGAVDAAPGVAIVRVPTAFDALAEIRNRRLGFVCTDRFTGVGPFLRPAGTHEHHSLFMIETPPFMKGCEHFTFHMGGPTDLMLAGARFVEKGYQSFWGPGRHKFGSNWFWYFNSPLGCHVEYDADMDRHDERWSPREVPMGADASQLFLFQHREKWAPSGPPPGGLK